MLTNAAVSKPYTHVTQTEHQRNRTEKQPAHIGDELYPYTK